jgi:hypothetical protein
MVVGAAGLLVNLAAVGVSLAVLPGSSASPVG